MEEKNTTRNSDIRIPLSATLSFEKPVDVSKLNLGKISTIIQTGVLRELAALSEEDNGIAKFSSETDAEFVQSSIEQLKALLGIEIKEIVFKADV